MNLYVSWKAALKFTATPTNLRHCRLGHLQGTKYKCSHNMSIAWQRYRRPKIHGYGEKSATLPGGGGGVNKHAGYTSDKEGKLHLYISYVSYHCRW